VILGQVNSPLELIHKDTGNDSSTHEDEGK
jgi:hypothetical protein